jgi:hypothetical protein
MFRPAACSRFALTLDARSCGRQRPGWKPSRAFGPATTASLQCSNSPNEIDRFEVLEANWTGLGDPTHGIVVGNDFYFIANSGWDRVGENGAFKPGAAAEIWKLRL